MSQDKDNDLWLEEELMTGSQADSVSFATVPLLSFLNNFVQVFNTSFPDSAATSKVGVPSEMWSQETEMKEYMLRVKKNNELKEQIKEEEKQEFLREQRRPYLLLAQGIDPNLQRADSDKSTPPLVLLDTRMIKPVHPLVELSDSSQDEEEKENYPPSPIYKSR